MNKLHNKSLLTVGAAMVAISIVMWMFSLFEPYNMYLMAIGFFILLVGFFVNVAKAIDSFYDEESKTSCENKK